MPFVNTAVIKKMMMNKSYSELLRFSSLEDRLKYLSLPGRIGEETFGIQRIYNQSFYHQPKWRRLRDRIIIRDNGCELGVKGYDIFGVVYIHHINPITLDDLKYNRSIVWDPENLISCSYQIHSAIHYGAKKLHQIDTLSSERHPYDTCPWR